MLFWAPVSDIVEALVQVLAHVWSGVAIYLYFEKHSCPFKDILACGPGFGESDTPRHS